MKRRRGFSLAELVIAVIVIGILSTLAFMGFRAIVSRSSDAKQVQTTRSVLKQAQALYLQHLTDQTAYTWEQAILESYADLPPYVALSEGTFADVDQMVQGYHIRTDTGTGDYTIAPNDVLIKVQNNTLYVATYISATKAVFGYVTDKGSPSTWAASCIGTACDAESASSGPPASGDYGGALPATPGAPTLQTLIASSTSAVDLTWLAPSGASGISDYTVKYRVAGAATWSVFPRLATTALSANVTGLTPGTQYEFTVAAVNASGLSPFSSVLLTYTLTSAPSISATTPIGGGATLTLSPPASGAATVLDYSLQYKLASSSVWVTFSHAASSSTSQDVTGLTGGDLYDFRVAAINGGGTSAYSSSVQSTTLAPPPTFTSAPGSASCGSPYCITPTWSPPIQGAASLTDYTLQYRLTGTTTWTNVAHTASTATTRAVTGLAAGSSYDFQVKGVAPGGDTPFSTAYVGITPTAAPTAVAATSGATTQTVVTWTAPTAAAGAEPTLYTATATPGSGSCTSSTTTCTITGLTNGTTYSISVTSTNAGGDSNASSAASATPYTTAGAPTSVQVNSGQNAQILVSWTAPTSTGGNTITAYNVTSTPGSFTCTTATLSCSVTGLTNGTAYTFTVSATNSAGTSSSSAESAPATPYTVPSAPTGVTAASGASSQTVVTWTASASANGSDITGYTATASPGSASCTTTSTTCTITGLSNGTSYTIGVVATNAAGNSTAATASATPYTLPGTPTVGSTTRGYTVGTATSWVDVTVTAGATNGSAVTGYTARCTSSNGGVTVETAGGSNPVRVASLTPRSTYTCTAKTTNAAGSSAFSGASSAFSSFGVPAQPAAVSAYETSSQSQLLGVSVTGASSGGQALTSVQVSCVSSNGGPTLTYSWTASLGANGDASYNNQSISWGTNVAGRTYSCTSTATNAAGTSAATGSNTVTLYGYPYPGPYGYPYPGPYGYPYPGPYGYPYPGPYGYPYPGPYGYPYPGPYGAPYGGPSGT